MDNYNNGFPVNYQQVQPSLYYQPTQTQFYQLRGMQTPYYQNPQVIQNAPQAQQNTNNGYIFWVQGIEGAKSYILPNNTTVPLWDSESQTIYIKSVDNSGKPSLTILDYVERNDTNITPDNQPVVEYATKDQVESLNKQFAEVIDKLNSLNGYVTTEQFENLNSHLDDLGNQIDDIENRITSFGKPQQSSNSNNRRNK